METNQQNKNWFMRHEVLYIILAVLLLVLIVGSVAWWKAEKQISDNRYQITDTQNSTANWKTYANTEYGFEFKYPNETEYKVLDTLGSGLVGLVAAVLPDGQGGSILIYVKNSTESYEETIVSMDGYESNSEIVLDGRVAQKFKFNTEIGGEIMRIVVDTSPVLIIEYRTYLGEISEKNYNDIVIQILSTFKFFSSVEVNSFNTCEEAGYPIMESYPERCATPDGLVFVKNYGGCAGVVVDAQNPKTGEWRQFPTPCDVPEGWLRGQ